MPHKQSSISPALLINITMQILIAKIIDNHPSSIIIITHNLAIEEVLVGDALSTRNWRCNVIFGHTLSHGEAIVTLEPFGIENPDLVPIQFLRFVAKFQAHDAVDQDVEGRVGQLKVCRNCSLHFV